MPERHGFFVMAGFRAQMHPAETQMHSLQSWFSDLRMPLRVAAGRTIGCDMDAKTTAAILRVIERAPHWLRHDLEAKDDAARRRAEETLAAMISDSLANEEGAPRED